MEETIKVQQENELKEVNHVRGVIEAILFANEKPVTLEQIKKVIDTVSLAEIKAIILEIQQEFELRKNGITIVEIAGGYQMLTNSLYASYLRDFYKTKHKEKLSKPALETLAIIAYKQPVTRTDVETIRGVNSDGVVVHLIEKELIKIVGRKDIPGRPYLYGTTKQFLEYFGLKSLDDLPSLEEFTELSRSAEEQVTASEAAPAQQVPQAAEVVEAAADGSQAEQTQSEEKTSES